jgi:hypothetical protein
VFTATGAGTGTGTATTQKTFRVKLNGFDPYGFPIEEELPEVVIDEPSSFGGGRTTIFASKVFSRVTRWQYITRGMETLVGAQFDQIQVGWDFNFNRNKPIYLWIAGTTGSYDFTYKGQTVNFTFAQHDVIPATIKTRLETLSNIAVGEAIVDEPFFAAGTHGLATTPFRIWIDNTGAGSGTPMTAADSDDRDDIFVDQVAGDIDVWISSPRYINQENQGIGIPLLSDPYGPDTPYAQAEFITGHMVNLTDGIGSYIMPAARTAAGTRVSAGLELGKNSVGANARSSPQKFSLWLERFNQSGELFLPNGQILPWDVLYDDLEVGSFLLTVQNRTTRGMGRDALAKSAYVWG